MAEQSRILVVNPGSTSTKIAVFETEGQKADMPLQEIFSRTLRHDAEELQSLGTIADQLDFRKHVVGDALRENGHEIGDFDAIACRGGLVRQLPSGTYRVNDALVNDCRIGVCGQHASNLGALIGSELERESGVPAYIIDPPVVNELSEIARYSGHPSMERTCVWHALNQKAVARRYSESVGKAYEDLNLLVCHMGGGVSVGAHVKGRVLDTEDAVGGEGPFSPERAGSLPVNKIIDLCFRGDMTKTEIKRMLTRKAGLMAYAGTNKMQEILKKAEEGDAAVQEALEAFYYQIAKEIAAMSVAMKGQVDQIIFTGGIAYSQVITDAITEMVGWIAPVTVYPGEDEMEALALGALRVLRGDEEAKEY
ncbi:MAG: butyrate kinase [Bacillota bacterium]